MILDVKELNSVQYRVYLVDQGGVPIRAVDLHAVIATLYNGDSDTGTDIINGRDHVDLLTLPPLPGGLERVIYDEQTGLLIWNMDPEDSPVVNQHLRTENHRLELDVTFGPDNRIGSFVQAFRVQNLRKRG